MCTARCGSCGWARASTPQGNSRPKRSRARRRRWSTTPSCCAVSRCPRCGWSATSATRDAANRDVFFAMTAEVLGAVVPGAVAEVITGTEEAGIVVPRRGRRIGPRRSTFRGRRPRRRLDRSGARCRGDVDASFSADIGCVRLTERCLHSDPPTAVEIAAAREVVRERLGEALRVVPVERARTWVGVAGTMTTLSALAQKMTTYDSEAIHLSRVGFGDLLAVCDELIAMTRQQRAALGPMHEGRVDVIGGGAIVVEELARCAGQPGGHRRAGRQRARHPRRHRAVDRLASGDGANIARVPSETHFVATLFASTAWSDRAGPQG